MRDRLEQHEPRAEFAARLESKITHEIRRRNQLALAPQWATWSPVQVLAAAAVVIIASMGLGGAVVASAYEIQNNQTRDQLLSRLEQRADVARQRLELTTTEREAAQRRFEVGMIGSRDVLEKGRAVVEAEAEVALVALDLEEVRLSGREPRHELSAPKVSGRDFVGERLQVELSVPGKVLEVERRLASDVQKRVEIGVFDPVELEVSRSRVLDVEVALDTIRRKIELRKQFLAGKMDSVETELRVLETEAERKTKTLGPKIELARQEVARLEQRAAMGLAQTVDVAEATLRRLELETALSRAELDLALIRRRIRRESETSNQ